MTDPITDMFNRIRNAQAVFHAMVAVPFSGVKYEIAKVLEREELIEKVEKKGRKTKKVLEITLKYKKETPEEGEQGKMEPAISGLKRVSKLGQRIYFKFKDIKPIRGGYGISIISTPKGIMTNKEARKKKLGGEVICEVW